VTMSVVVCAKLQSVSVEPPTETIHPLYQTSIGMAANIYDSILLFGDSITEEGWAAGGLAQRLAEAYGGRMDVINRGLGGYNSEWGLTVFQELFATKEAQRSLPTVRLLTIWWGANDSVLPGEAQHVGIAKFAENLHTTISMVTSPTSPYYSPHTRIILITPPPVNPNQWPEGPEDPLNVRNNLNTEAYVRRVVDVAKETEVEVVDAWGLFWEKADGNEERLAPYLSDGLHLTAAGNEVVFNEIMAKIKSKYPELHPDNYDPIFPEWEQIDPDNIPARNRS